MFLRRVFNFTIRTEQFAGANPASQIALYREEKRARFLQRDELPRLFAALAAETNQDLVDFVTLSLWTGARKSDVLSMRWHDVQLDDNRWCVADPKGGESYQIALTREAVEILTKRKNDSEFVFLIYWQVKAHRRLDSLLASAAQARKTRARRRAPRSRSR